MFQVLVTVLGGLRAVEVAATSLGSSLMAVLIRFGWQQARRRALLRKCRAASKYHYPRKVADECNAGPMRKFEKMSAKKNSRGPVLMASIGVASDRGPSPLGIRDTRLCDVQLAEFLGLAGPRRAEDVKGHFEVVAGRHSARSRTRRSPTQ